MPNVLKRMIHSREPDPAETAHDRAQETKEMRECLTERQIDEALEDTFPASDPPAWY